MSKGTLHELNAFGQSVWLDNICRPMIESGELKTMIGLGLRGITSNPTIFDKAISSSIDYDEKILELYARGRPTFDVYDDLTVRDVQDATDEFLSVFRQTGGLDGFVSLEVNPKLAHNLEETLKEGKRLYKKLGRPNVMLKVPATDVGYKAIEEFIALGMNINATLIFSVEQYVNTANAYIRGIKRLVQNNGSPDKVRSVASVFVSRVDTSVDNLLEQFIIKESDPEKKKLIASLKGMAAVSNCGIIYKKYREIFSSSEFNELKEKGAHLQRVLWASTSTKNPAYNDLKYVSELIAKDTVNTMPEQTFCAYLDHGKVNEALTKDDPKYEQAVASLNGLAINLDQVCSQLLKDGVAAFEKSFDSLLASIEKKKKVVCKS